MDEKLASHLKEFYTLETFQVAFYKEQMAAETDDYHIKAFEKLSNIEAGHVNYFAEILDKAQIELPGLIGSFFQMAGKFLGVTVISGAGIEANYKLGIALETKAAQDYRKFIEENRQKKYSEINNRLLENLLDEEFHLLWLRESLKQLQS